MPGSSLWLLPPGNDPLNRFLSSLIDRTSLHFASEHRFLPHITLTSSIQESKHSTDPQAWLDNLDLPKNVTVKFDRVASEDVFFRKLYVKVVKDGSLTALGEAARKTVEGDESAEAWARDEFMPHLSLM